DVVDFLVAAFVLRHAVLAGNEQIITIEVLAAQERFAGFFVVGLQGDRTEGMEFAPFLVVGTGGRATPAALASDDAALVIVGGVVGKDHPLAVAGRFVH